MVVSKPSLKGVVIEEFCTSEDTLDRGEKNQGHHDKVP